jgi:hypothetical protein
MAEHGRQMTIYTGSAFLFIALVFFRLHPPTIGSVGATRNVCTAHLPGRMLFPAAYSHSSPDFPPNIGLGLFTPGHLSILCLLFLVLSTNHTTPAPKLIKHAFVVALYLTDRSLFCSRRNCSLYLVG